MSMDSLRNIQESSLKIELTKPEYWEDLKKIRLEAIENEPIALGITKDRKEEELRKLEEDWKKELTDHDNFTVLVRGNNIPVGMGQVVLENKDNGWWGIKGVYLNKDFRRSGSGEKMIVFILNEIKKRGGKRVYLNVVDTQDVAREIYKKLGFRVYQKFESEIINGVEHHGFQWMGKEI